MALPGSLQIDWSFPGCALHPAATLTALIRSVPEIWEGLGLVGMTILLCGSWGCGIVAVVYCMYGIRKPRGTVGVLQTGVVRNKSKH